MKYITRRSFMKKAGITILCATTMEMINPKSSYSQDNINSEKDDLRENQVIGMEGTDLIPYSVNGNSYKPV
jgi:hypothetical protein